MNYKDFLNEVIERGLLACKETYKNSKNKDDLEGAVDGFESCRGKTVHQLEKELRMVNKIQQDAFRERIDNYWYYDRLRAEVYWVCSVVSVILINEGGTPIGDYLPSKRAHIFASEILKDGDHKFKMNVVKGKI